MRKFFLFAALGLTMMAQAVELDYYKTLVSEQADASKGQTKLFNLEYYSDGSQLVLADYQTASSEEVGLNFGDQTFKGGTGSKVGLSSIRNAFFAKLDAEGNVLWAKADTTGDYDLGNAVIATTADGGVLFADKFRKKSGVYMSFFNLYDKDGKLVASNNMSFTNYDSIEVDGKNVKRKDAFSWSGAAVDEDGFVYIAGLQGDTLLPVWNDSIAPRKAWNTKGSLSANCNTVILKYEPKHNTYLDLDFVSAATTNDLDLVYDRPLGLHYEGGKLYVAGTYSNGTETGIYAAKFNAADLTREFIEFHPVAGSLQFQQTKFEDGKILICGGLGKNGTITIGEKTVEASTTAANSGLVYIINMADGKAVDAAVNASGTLNITVAAFPTDSDIVAYNYVFGTQVALHYDANLQLVSADTIATKGGSSLITCVGRSFDGSHTAVGLRAGKNADFELFDGTKLNFADKTNWYSVIAVLKSEGQSTDVETVNETSQKAVKFIQNGNLFIRYNGRVMNVLGL